MPEGILSIQDGPEKGRVIVLASERMVLGREDDCDIRINHGSISRHHAVLTLQNNTWAIDDLQSQNGVFVNNERVAGSRTLFPPCQIRFGLVNTMFTIDQPVSVAELPAEIDVERVRAMGDVNAAIGLEFGKVIVGQKQVAEELLIAIAAGGHCLMIGLPGLAKTLMVSTMARILDLQFKRVQFTPDLMPSDIVGTEVLDIDDESGRKSFRFIKGPVFTNMLLADEINRTPPKTQAALLEAMQEKQVTAANQHFQLPPPFFVLATQNPLEQEGTYPLPEAQLDRFMFNILVDYPSETEEEAIVMATTGSHNAQLKKVLGAEQLLALQDMVRALPVSPHVVKYATRLVRMTRPTTAGSPEFIRQQVHCGAGPRAAQCLILGAKARAVLQGRVNVACSDVKALALPVLRHRIFTNFAADSEGVGADDIIRKLLSIVPEPGEKDY